MSTIEATFTGAPARASLLGAGAAKPDVTPPAELVTAFAQARAVCGCCNCVPGGAREQAAQRNGKGKAPGSCGFQLALGYLIGKLVPAVAT